MYVNRGTRSFREPDAASRLVAQLPNPARLVALESISSGFRLTLVANVELEHRESANPETSAAGTDYYSCEVRVLMGPQLAPCFVAAQSFRAWGKLISWVQGLETEICRSGTIAKETRDAWNASREIGQALYAMTDELAKLDEQIENDIAERLVLAGTTQ